MAATVAGGRGAQRRLPPDGVRTIDPTPKGVAAGLAPAHGVRTRLGGFSGDVASLNHRLLELQCLRHSPSAFSTSGKLRSEFFIPRGMTATVAGGRGAQRRLPPDGVRTTDPTPKGVAAGLESVAPLARPQKVGRSRRERLRSRFGDGDPRGGSQGFGSPVRSPWRQGLAKAASARRPLPIPANETGEPRCSVRPLENRRDGRRGTQLAR